MQTSFLHKNKSIKGFSLLEILIVIAIMGSVGLMIFTSGGDSKARQIQADFDNIVSYLSLYKNKAIGNSKPYFLNMQTVISDGNITTSISPFSYVSEVFGNQDSCELYEDSLYEAISNEKIFSSEVSQLKICQQGVGNCTDSGIETLGICFFTDGSSRFTGTGSALLVQGRIDNDSSAAYRIDLHSATSFFEKLRCKPANILIAAEDVAYCNFAENDSWKTYE